MSSAARDASSWRRLLGDVGGFVLGGVLLVAAWTKILDPVAFARQIELEGLAFLFPALAVALLAVAIEVALGAALVLLVRRPAVVWTSAALVVFFLFLTGRAYWRHLRGIAPADEAGCGCFGNLVQRTPAEAFWGDVLMLVPALALAFLAMRRGAWPLGRSLLVGVVTFAALLFAWKAPQLPLDDLATRLSPGVEVAGICAGSEDDGTHVCLGGILPELESGEHVVILAELLPPENAAPAEGPDSADEGGAGFGEHVDALNDYYWQGAGPRLWVVHSGSEEAQLSFQFLRGPAFDLIEAPSALLRPLYRTLPRSFLVEGGAVVATWSGLPPLGDLSAADREDRTGADEAP